MAQPAAKIEVTRAIKSARLILALSIGQMLTATYNAATQPPTGRWMDAGLTDDRWSGSGSDFCGIRRIKVVVGGEEG